MVCGVGCMCSVLGQIIITYLVPHIILRKPKEGRRGEYSVQQDDLMRQGIEERCTKEGSEVGVAAVSEEGKKRDMGYEANL
ncbi:hypothetical protein EON63_15545 [archaeon]|nr:MAG: hypothetical protein EON63_15545 [archaeon]